MLTKIAAITAYLTEARQVVYTVQGEDGHYTFTAPDANAAAEMMSILHAMAALEPVEAAYADAPGAPSPSEPSFAHELLCRVDGRSWLIDRLVPMKRHEEACGFGFNKRLA